ncbi:MAG: DUF4241 domain-containing protein [Bacteroidetes bacterium]|nr:MAG: DUF4241 domain-containing protein [Bacteroidota bacterium]
MRFLTISSVSLLISIGFAGCDIQYKPVGNLKAQPPLDTVAFKPNTVIEPKWLQTAFVNGTEYTIGKEKALLFGVELDSVELPTGKLIACDPLHTDEYGKVFTQVFPVGKFPAQAALLALGGAERVAMVRIVFSNEPVAKWAVAVPAGQQAADMQTDDKPGFATDAGLAIYVDSLTLIKIPFDSLSSFNTGGYRELKAKERKTWKGGLYSFTGGNALLISTGLGDGKYASYIGYNNAGKPVQLVTDFRLVKW